jgi:hypothetical protein
VTERKICNTHLLETWEAIIYIRRKRAKKGEKARKVTERKMGNKHLLEACKLHVKREGVTK